MDLRAGGHFYADAGTVDRCARLANSGTIEQFPKESTEFDATVRGFYARPNKLDVRPRTLHPR